ncbi:AAA family ATPase [Rhodococcus sp. D-1]|uniref:AAA family ATPase n=1 Tax=Rhodococcus sp. D-1 TaxID=1912238 RepID=UPI001C4CD41B|nr:AAA family ATPase [Rhodococcus sp. D-1]
MSTTTPDTAYLHPNDWDDWFRYETTFFLEYVDPKGVAHQIGDVKIGQYGMGDGGPRDAPHSPGAPFRRPRLPQKEFRQLSRGDFFSVGQSADYYEALQALGLFVRVAVLTALNDLAYDLELLSSAEAEEVTTASLLRYVGRNTVTRQFHRMAQGHARLTPYRFAHHQSGEGQVIDGGLEFRVIPDSKPPSNVQVLIGRNGVGKTRFLDRMSRALVGAREEARSIGNVVFEASNDGSVTDFSKVVSVSFSAFDSLPPVTVAGHKDYVYVGLKAMKGPDGQHRRIAQKPASWLAEEFADGVSACAQGERLERWRNALRHLEADPGFKDHNIADIAADHGDTNSDQMRGRAVGVYANLSSGHKCVLLTITKLVEHVEEASLVLLDEPESHLHPPLLSAFVRALSDLLVNRNGVAVVATHSPVVLQEAPKDCVWILKGSVGDRMRWKRPPVETFGENVSVLTHMVFGLEVTNSGFYQFLSEAVDQNTDDTYEDILESLGRKLGGEGRSILRGLVATRDKKLGL